jgi:selenophosphate synthetase-related protein
VSDLADVVRRFREHPGRRGKAALSLVGEILGADDHTAGPGDDAAVIPDGDGHLLAAGEAIWPPLVEADPYGAGVAAVVANVNDVAAMGGRPTAIVDAVVAPEASARLVLEGLRMAADLYRVPVVGGHLTARGGPPSLSAFVLGRARALLPAVAVVPGQAVLVAACLEGHLQGDLPAFTSIEERGPNLADDLEVLPRVAEAGAAVAAKDVSMAGLLGSLAMLLEATGTGAEVDLDSIPVPVSVGLPDWLSAFPNYAFLLTAAPERAEDVRRPFLERGLACEVIGRTDDSGLLGVRLGGERSDLIDLGKESVTGLR